MDTTTYFLYFVFACLGFAAGAIVAGARQRKQPPLTGDQPPAPEGSIEVLRIWRSTDGQLKLGMDGQQLPGSTALQPDQRRRLIKLVIDLRPFLEAPVEVQTAAPAGPAAAAAPAVPAAPAVSAASMAAVQTAPAPSRPTKEKVAPPVIKSIIEQIEDVLQAKLAGTALEKREIHLTEGPLGSVIVKIGLNKYEGIDAVPDPEIQGLIRQAVGDWEKGTR